MTWAAKLARLNSAVFRTLADAPAAVYIPAAEVATWHKSKTSTAYLSCSLIIDRDDRPRDTGVDFIPAGHEIEARVRASEVPTPEFGAQFYVASGAWAGRWQIIERPEFDGTVYVMGVRSV